MAATRIGIVDAHKKKTTLPHARRGGTDRHDASASSYVSLDENFLWYAATTMVIAINKAFCAEQKFRQWFPARNPVQWKLEKVLTVMMTTMNDSED